MNWLRKSVIWQAPTWRAVFEGLISGWLYIIALILVAEELPDATIRAGIFFSSVLTGTIAGFRARPLDASIKKRIQCFVLAALSLTILLPLGAGIASVILKSPNFFERTGVAEFEALLMLICCSVVYACWRIFGMVWRRYQYMRRTRFAWSMTAASTNVVVAFAVFIMLVEFIYAITQNFSASFASVNASWAARALRELAVFIFPQLMIFWFGLVFVLFITIPPLLIFSYFSTHRLTRRIEALADATRRLQQGDLSARALVSGEDEVAQLQTTFNEMAENLQKATQALQSEKDKVTSLLNTQREMSVNISHELRTPVAALRAYLENNLAQNQGLSPKLRNDLEIMTHETEQLQKMVDDLFTLAQREANQLSLNMQLVEPDVFLSDWVEKFRPVAWKNNKVDLQFAVVPSLPFIQADPQRLEQIMNNLVQNAVRHTLPGGLVQVEAAQIDHHVRISVRDNGEGIPAQDLPHVWERYFRGKNHQHQGSGLGLALVKELAESMGAKVGVESTVGEGSHFWVEWGMKSK